MCAGILPSQYIHFITHAVQYRSCYQRVHAIGRSSHMTLSARTSIVLQSVVDMGSGNETSLAIAVPGRRGFGGLSFQQR